MEGKDININEKTTQDNVDESKESDSSVDEDPATFTKLEEFLKEKVIEYNLTTHEPTKTSQESADVRGVTLDSGAKAMLIVDHSKKFNLEFFL